MKSLLEAGVHFGHQTRRWDPRMRPYIFTERNGIHIIDLQQTVTKLNAAYQYVRDLVAGGQTVLLVGTKKQAQEAVETEAKRSSMFYVNQRWLGGMLTNFRTIQERIKRLEELEWRDAQGELDRLPKKEATRLRDEAVRLNRLLGGIRGMKDLPGALFIVDPHRERIAVAESHRLEIPIVAMCDTNCNPDEVDYPIPANDDAIRAIKLLVNRVAEAAIEGERAREIAAEAEAAAAEAEAEEAAEKIEPVAAAEITEEMLRSAGEVVFVAEPNDEPGSSRAAEPADDPGQEG
ncbi:MAG: 30S ribosomal protein S2 [Bacteroidetes bacterium]|nr:30S ribosomal protein S2 [Bacteroidota bacterium]MCL5026500.1 30S ribosomal protein S2 [Chloroflexota bacterium]